jgi:KRAB domain-containing zinc finger protein
MELSTGSLLIETQLILLSLIHISQEQLQTEFLCMKCGKKFTSSHSLDKHKTKFHSKTPKLFTCVICYKNYEFRSQLESHLKRIHDDSRKINCSKCGKKFSNKTCFSTHIKKFHPVRPSIQ